MRISLAKRDGLASVAIAAVLAVSPAAFADFEEDLARVTKALETNPSRVLPQAIVSCLGRRQFALQLYYQGREARAARRLKCCFSLLEIPETAPQPTVAAATPENLRAKANRELEKALSLTPNIANGLQIYRECADSHMPEGWGLEDGSVPHIAA
jgi:hypothetical protein